MEIPFLEKRKFVLVIGDDGAVLAYINKKKVEKRLFTTSPALSDRRDFHVLLTKYPTVPVCIILDTMEQSYTKQTLPAVNILAVNKLVKKRLDRDFAASDIKGAVLFGRDDFGRRDWIYMFAATPVTPVLSEWIDYISSLENKFTGIYMLPVEMENFVKKLNKNFSKKEKSTLNKKPNKKKAGWQFIVTNNKTGGFRQVILHNEKVIFTRLIRPGKDSLPDIVAGNIEQEILNTIDYLQRLSFREDNEIQVIAILSTDLKKSLQSTKIRGKEIQIYTPFEVANAIGLPGTAGKEDKFSDLVIATNFVNSRPVLKLEDPKMKQINNLLTAYNLSTALIMAIVPVFVIYSGYMAFTIMQINKKVEEVENEKTNIEKKWRNARESDEYDIDDANKITDFVTLHNELIKTVSPLDLIRDTSALHKSYALTRSMTWNYEIVPQTTRGKKEEELEKAIFNMEFVNNGDSLEELFRNFDSFTRSINKKLSGYYQIDISDLPNTVTFDNKSQPIPIQIKISSGNLENSKKRK